MYRNGVKRCESLVGFRQECGLIAAINKRIQQQAIIIQKTKSSTMTEHVEQFEIGDAVSSDTIPTQAGAVKKGGYCMLKGFPCKVIEYSTAKPGKHGSAKATIVGIDIFTNKKHEDSCPTSHNMQVPIVNKWEMEVADISEDGFVSLIKEDGTLKEDLKLPNDAELKVELQKCWDEGNIKGQIFFALVKSCGQEKIVAGRLRENGDN